MSMSNARSAARMVPRRRERERSGKARVISAHVNGTN
jgi:hypothetical protein